MKKFLLLLLCCICLSCSDDNDSSISRYDIPAGLYPDIEKDDVVIIDSDAAFREAFAKTEGSLPAINFRERNLLLVSGVSTYGITDVNSRFVKDGEKYRLTIAVGQNLTTVVEPWCIGYRIPKNLNTGDISLTISYSLDQQQSKQAL